MGLIHWKQIDGDLAGSRVLTGSLRISGSIEIEALLVHFLTLVL